MVVTLVVSQRFAGVLLVEELGEAVLDSRREPHPREFIRHFQFKMHCLWHGWKLAEGLRRDNRRFVPGSLTHLKQICRTQS